MIVSWAHAAPTILAAFLASLVEGVEALTVVLAVGSIRGWRSALIGTGAALAVLLVLVAALGPALTRIPLESLQIGVGTLLLLFGLRWLRKAILRAAGIIPLHDEAASFAEQSNALRAVGASAQGFDKIAVGTSFNIVMLEGVEVVFIVVAMGVGQPGLLLPAALGAVAALALVTALGLLLHRPLASIPENMLKFGVGVLLSAFGTFWVGEGIGIVWPGADWSLLVLVVLYLAAAILGARAATMPAARPPSPEARGGSG